MTINSAGQTNATVALSHLGKRDAVSKRFFFAGCRAFTCLNDVIASRTSNKIQANWLNKHIFLQLSHTLPHQIPYNRRSFLPVEQ